MRVVKKGGLLDTTTRLKLEELRKEAFKRLEDDKHKATDKERRGIFFSGQSIAPVEPRNVERLVKQMGKDIKTYPIYDCLAMWLDPDYGLAHYEPEIILAVGERLLP